MDTNPKRERGRKHASLALRVGVVSSAASKLSGAGCKDGEAREIRTAAPVSFSRLVIPCLCTLPENLCVRLAEIYAVQRAYDYTVAAKHSLVIIEEVDHLIASDIHSVQRQLRLEFRFGELRI